MRSLPVRGFLRALAALLILLAVGSAAPAAAAYPRRIAVAPFASLTKDDIAGTVSVLPRLLASRLMALAGADVLLLPAGGKSPEEAAREAKYPLLLQGTVSKLGKGYSIDTTVIDLATGKNAGAFFAAAATEDDIIAQLGVLSGEIAEKVFDVQGAVRAVSPQPAAPAPTVVPAPVPLQTIGGGPQPPAAQTPSAQAATARAATSEAALVAALQPTTLAGGWNPSSLKELGDSGKIPDALLGMAAVGTDADGNTMVAAYGKTTLYMYLVKGKEIVPFTRFTKGLDDHFLNVAAFDVDGDGAKEILVTDLVGSKRVESFVLKRQGETYAEVATGIPYFLVVLPDWGGKPALVGQYQGSDRETPFQGRIVTLRWDGKGFTEGEKLPQNNNLLPLAYGVLGLSSARFGDEWRLIYTDENSYLRIVDSTGVSQYRSMNQYNSTPDYFEWGPIIEIDGHPKWIYVRNGVGVAGGSGGSPLIVASEGKRGALNTVSSTRLVLLRWEGGEFREKAATQGSGKFITDAVFLSSGPFEKGGKVVACVIDEAGGFFRDKASRLLLFEAQ